MRLRTTPLRLKMRSPTQLPTAFEVRLKTQWESADTTEQPADVRYLQVGLSSQHPAARDSAPSRAGGLLPASAWRDSRVGKEPTLRPSQCTRASSSRVDAGRRAAPTVADCHLCPG